MFVSILLSLGVISLVYLYLIWNNKYWKKRGVAFDKPVLLAGSFPGSTMQKVSMLYEIDRIYQKHRDQSPYVGIFSGRKPQLMVLDPTLVKDVLITNFKSFHDNEFASLVNKDVDPIFSRNPFMLCGQEWKEKRSEITPAFTNMKIRSMYPMIEDVCSKMKVFIDKEIETKPLQDGFDAKELASRFTTDVVSSCIYNVDSKAFTDEKSEIRQMGSNLFDTSTWVTIYFVLLQIFPFIQHIYKVPFVPKKTEKFFTNLMKDAIKMRETSKIERDDFLQYLLQLRKKKNLPDIEMAAHTITFFLDGYETSSVVIAHMLYYVAADKEIQTKLRNEIRETFKEHDGKINSDILNDMAYLDQVFNETLRKNPPLGYTTKLCTIPTEFTDFKDKKVQIDKGMVVMIPSYSIQHDPEHYPEPSKFDPERFSPENGGLKTYKDKCVFLPFGDGPRICLGMKFGSTQSKAAIFQIFKDFELSVNKKSKEPFEFDPKNFFSMPLGGIWLDIKPIK